MDAYSYPIATAVAIFPLLSAVFTLPYVINQYHKYGALLVLRIILVYSFIFYMMTSYFMTILPLPPIDSVEANGTHMLLVPFNAFMLWWNNCGFQLNDPSTYVSAFMNYDFFQMAFNVLLLIPLGVYLTYYFERKWYQVLLISFAYSLFFELTQLSGLYGIYPHPYRWFEVDDLICNTLGGVIGFLITPLCSFFLPSRDRLDEMSYHKGERVSIIRRSLANLIDWSLIVILLYILKRNFLNTVQLDDFFTFYKPNSLFIIIASFLFYFVISSWIMGGRTIGKYIVSLKVSGENGRKAKFRQYLLRYAIVYLLVVPTPFYILNLLRLFNETQNIWTQVGCAIGISILAIIFVFVIVNVMICSLLHRLQVVYEKVSHTKQVSAVIKRLDTVYINEDLYETEIDKDGNNENHKNSDDKNKDYNDIDHKNRNNNRDKNDGNNKNKGNKNKGNASKESESWEYNREENSDDQAALTEENDE